MFKNQKVLILAPHTDDAELGCGATIAKLTSLGNVISVINFSTAEESLPKGFSKGATHSECQEAQRRLGVRTENIEILDFPVRRFSEFRQDILQHMVDLRNKINPSIVFTPNSFDCHQDHQVISSEAFRAFKYSTVLGYELPWNLNGGTFNCQISVDEANVQAKLYSLDAYASQKTRIYFDPDVVKGALRKNGVRAATQYAEIFEVINLHAS